jgi:hypothetical protein
MKTKTNVKAGGLGKINHGAKLMVVKSNVKAGGLGKINHSMRLA